MPERKAYFISLDKNRISEVSVPDTTEYEVLVTNEELETYKSLVEASGQRDFSYALENIVFKPFAEVEPDEMRKKDDDNLMLVFQFLYQYGTPETKRKLEEVGYQTK